MSNGLVKASADPQKKGRTITFRVDESVAEGAAGNVGNDRANCHQTVIKGWKSASRWAGYLPWDLLLWAGNPGYNPPPT